MKRRRFLFGQVESLRPGAVLRAHSIITSPVDRRCIATGYVAKTQEYPDIPAFSRLARRAPRHPKLRTYFFVTPND